MIWNPVHHEFLLLYIGGYNNTTNPYLGRREVFAQRLDGDTGLPIGSAVEISQVGNDVNSGYWARHIDAVVNPVEQQYFVAWVASTPSGHIYERVQGQRLDFALNEVGADNFGVRDPNGFRVNSPAIVWNADDNEYLVAWSEWDATNGTEVYGQLLASNGAEIGANDFRISDFGPAGDFSYQANLPDVVYNAALNEYLVAWHGNRDPYLNHPEIYVQRLDAAGHEIGPNDQLISRTGSSADPSFNNRVVDVHWDSNHNDYLFVWYGALLSGAPEEEVFAHKLDAITGAVVMPMTRISHMGPDGNTMYFANSPDLTFNPIDHEALITWQGDDNSGALTNDEFEIYGQLIADHPPSDSDGDGRRDSLDLCDGSDDKVDTDGDGIPNGCDVCEGTTPVAFRLTAGADDNFLHGTDPSTRSGELNALSFIWHDFDDASTIDGAVGHTFSSLPDQMQSATLTVKLDGPILTSENDFIRLQLIDGNPTWGWTSRLNSTNLLGPGWTGIHTVTLDLANLPLSSGGTVSLLQHISGGSLDVVLEDDTVVDFMRLDFTSCGDTDCNTNGIPDGMEADANTNGIPDDCEFNSDDDGDGYTENEGDCDDDNASVHPDATEVCNGVDDDCSGTVDDGLLTRFYRDQDGDFYGDDAHSVEDCSPPVGYVLRRAIATMQKQIYIRMRSRSATASTTTATVLSMKGLMQMQTAFVIAKIRTSRFSSASIPGTVIWWLSIPHPEIYVSLAQRFILWKIQAWLLSVADSSS